jgi:hypothetical protein
LSGELQGGESCNSPPGTSEAQADQRDLACILCGNKMYYAQEFRVHVCMNGVHGVFAYYGPDSCYFTSREDVGLKLAKEGKKFHMIEGNVLNMMGVNP